MTFSFKMGPTARVYSSNSSARLLEVMIKHFPPAMINYFYIFPVNTENGEIHTI